MGDDTRVKGAVYVNGRIAAADKAVIPVYDHGFLYGEGVYETLRTYNRVPFLFERHCNRLRASAGYLNLEVPFRTRAAAWTDETVAAAGADAGSLHSRAPDTRGR